MKLLESKMAALGGVILVVIVIVLTFGLRPAWWAFIDLFFLFMMAFSHLAAVFLGSYNRRAGKKLDRVAAVCGVLWILALIGEFVAFQVLI